MALDQVRKWVFVNLSVGVIILVVVLLT